jgi:hypothetical protein
MSEQKFENFNTIKNCLAVEIVLIIYINLQDILSSSFNILLDIIVPIMHN